MYTPAEVDALLRAEREATIRAMTRHLRAEIVGAIDDRLLIATRQILTTAEVGRLLSCSPSTVQRYVREGRLTPTEQRTRGGKDGGFTFHRADVLALADALRQERA